MGDVSVLHWLMLLIFFGLFFIGWELGAINETLKGIRDGRAFVTRRRPPPEADSDV